MKFKNYKSAVHNFADSFQSGDFSKSGKLALNALIHFTSNEIVNDYYLKTGIPEM